MYNFAKMWNYLILIQFPRRSTLLYVFINNSSLSLISSNPARKISVRKGLTDQETFERETASFEVELSHTEVEGIWQKDGIRVKPNNQWRVSTNGLVHSLTLSNLTLEDTGTIAFSAEGVRTTARLTVKGKYWPVDSL